MNRVEIDAPRRAGGNAPVIDVCLLGNGGMMPLPQRWLTALLIRCGSDIVLCDCGEGTQISWKHTSWGFKSVSTIALTHLHADHVAGLPGVLFMIAQAERTEPVLILGPERTREIVAALRTIVPWLPFPVEVRELSGQETLRLPGGLSLRAHPGVHRVPVLAYAFDRPRAPRFSAERAQALGVPVPYWSHLQRGQTVEVDGALIRPEQVLGEPRRGLTVAYVTDTRPTPSLPEFVRGADLLVCEGMYGDPEQLDRAVERGHMTFEEAATIAREAGARRLWLTHLSPSVERPEEHLPRARAIFPATEIGRPHHTLTLRFDDDEPPAG